ncbi:ankyrin repeat-containing domain protein [Mycena sanguinolenta]|nr:ankyrin repeat-containing domain protein [Mycena sanguinolenta]
MRLLEDGSPLFEALIKLYDSNRMAGRLALDSPLQFCVQEEYIEGITMILSTSRDSVNVVGRRSGTTVLVLASLHGRTDIIRLLLNNEADVNLHGRIYGSPLRIAMFNNHIKALQLLLEHGAADNVEKWGRVLKEASGDGKYEMVRILLGCAVNFNTKDERHIGAALCTAASRNYSDIVKLLLEDGAGLDLEDWGMALKIGSKDGSLESVRLLLGRGVDIGEAEEHYRAAVEEAFKHLKENVLNLLLEFYPTGRDMVRDLNSRRGWPVEEEVILE